MYSIKLQKEITPNLKMLEEIVTQLNQIFDAREIYHHSSNGEMFEYRYQSNDNRNESWGIFFLDKCVACGSIYGFGDYEDCQDDNYVFAIEENKKLISRMAYNATLDIFRTMFKYFAHSDVLDIEKCEIYDELQPNKKIFKYENCKSCVYTVDKCKTCKECDGISQYSELYNADPNCVHQIVCASSGGIKCTRCNGWFCF